SRELRDRDHSRVSFSHEDRQHLAGTDVEDIDPVGGYCVEDRIDLGRPSFRDIPLGQRARVHVERIGHAYSSRMPMMPWLHSLLSGLKPLLSNLSRSFLALMGLPRMPSCFMNFSQPATKFACSSRETRKSSSPNASSSRSASVRRGWRPSRCRFPGLRFVAIVCSFALGRPLYGGRSKAERTAPQGRRKRAWASSS